jgi:hypothetical protein
MVLKIIVTIDRKIWEIVGGVDVGSIHGNNINEIVRTRRERGVSVF